MDCRLGTSGWEYWETVGDFERIWESVKLRATYPLRAVGAAGFVFLQTALQPPGIRSDITQQGAPRQSEIAP